MKQLNRKLKRTGGRIFLLSLGFLLATAGAVQAQCPGNVDLQAVSIDPSSPVIGINATGQLVVIMRNNCPCAIPTGEAQVQITFSATYLDPAIPLSFTNTCPGSPWSYVTTVTAGGLHNMFFRNNAGPLPVGGVFCGFQFNVGGKGVISPAPVAITLASTLSGAAVSSDIDGSNQSASTQVLLQPILPVMLSDIAATGSSCNGILDWRTASEANVDRFDIEYSTNGSDFTTVGTVVAKNNPNGATYKYANAQGTARGYYRLKMVDRDGHFNYSKVVAVDTKCSGKTLTMYPNPLTASQNLTVIAGGYEGTIKGELLSVTGQVIRTYNLKNGTNILPVDRLAQATYMLRVSDASGDTESFRVVIMK
jgi:hypothetical protein